MAKKKGGKVQNQGPITSAGKEKGAFSKGKSTASKKGSRKTK